MVHHANATLSRANPWAGSQRTGSQRTQRASGVRVVVEWFPVAADHAHPTPGRVELIGSIAAGTSATWSCVHPESRGWEQAIGSSRCDEVVLTSWVGGDSLAKDMVLDLAEQLMQRLKESKSLIRVHFLHGEKGRVRAFLGEPARRTRSRAPRARA